MASLNKVLLIGRLGNQPELRYTPNQRAVTELRVACSHRWTDKAGQRQERTDWISVDVWDKTAEFCERWLGKGKEVFVEGRLTVDEWNDKDGQKRIKYKVVADRVEFVGSGSRSDGDGGGGRHDGPRGGDGGRGGDAGPGGPSGGPESFGGGGGGEDDIPF